MEKDIINLADKYVRQSIYDAFNCLKQTSSAIFQNRSIKPTVPSRCRSSSNNRNNRKTPFHNTLPRCSLPTTTYDLQTHFRIIQKMNKKRTRDVQYSYSLNKSWLTKFHKQRQNFANKVAEQSIQDALLQISDQKSSIEHSQLINSFADGLIHSIIDQAIEILPSSDIEHLSNHLAEDIITDVLLSISDNEKYSQKKSNQLESLENEQSIDSLVNNITQRIHTNSLDELKHTFEDSSPDIDASFIDLYSPRILGSCTLAWHLPSDSLCIVYYCDCLMISDEISYFVSPRLPALDEEM